MKKSRERYPNKTDPCFPSGWSWREKEQESCRNCRKRKNLPGKLIFRYDGRVYEYPFGEFPDTDWEIIDATIP